MSPKDFRKISHLEPKILNSLVNWPQTDGQTDKDMGLNLEVTPPKNLLALPTVLHIKSYGKKIVEDDKLKKCKNYFRG